MPRRPIAVARDQFSEGVGSRSGASEEASNISRTYEFDPITLAESCVDGKIGIAVGCRTVLGVVQRGGSIASFTLAPTQTTLHRALQTRSQKHILSVTTLENPLAELMSRIADGDRAALRQLYDATSAKLFGVCLRILSNRDESEDVLQEVYITIWRRADRFEAGRASVITWVSTIARNRAIDRLRARGPLAYAEQVDDMEIADGAESAHAILEAAQSGEALGRCLSTLDDRTEKVIRTAFFEGVTYEALAQRMATPLGTVKSWVRRGLLKLKECLDP